MRAHKKNPRHLQCGRICAAVLHSVPLSLHIRTQTVNFMSGTKHNDSSLSSIWGIAEGENTKNTCPGQKYCREREREGQTVKESFQTDVWCLHFGSSFLPVMKLGFHAKFHVITSANTIQHNTSQHHSASTSLSWLHLSGYHGSFIGMDHALSSKASWSTGKSTPRGGALWWCMSWVQGLELLACVPMTFWKPRETLTKNSKDHYKILQGY